MPAFDIIDDPWLDILHCDGSVATSSLREVLASAHNIAQLSESSPLTEVALLRFLIALASDGLRKDMRSGDDWAAFAGRCRDGFPLDAVDSILSPLSGRSNVLAPDHDALFDGPAVRQVVGWDNPKALQPASRFLPEVPVGTNIAHFMHANDDVSAVCIACLLKSRAAEAAFARGGLGPSLSRNLLATIGGMEPRYVVPRGQTLLESILLNLVVGDAGRPNWVAVHAAKQGVPGPLARLSWRPRLIMVASGSRTDQACIRCGSVERPRFTHAVMVDTYNHAGSPFGTKTDVESWKTTPNDPHLLPADKNTLTLGFHEEEWPLRALVRMLAGNAGSVLNQIAERAAGLGQVQITVTSTSGNQAKIDDAPHVGLLVPEPLVNPRAEERQAMAAALAIVFGKEHRSTRSDLIPRAVPDLFAKLAAGNEPQQVVKNWLAQGKQPAASARPEERSEMAGEAESLYEVARRAIRLLDALPPAQLTALRPPGHGGSLDAAAGQHAFTAVWHRLTAVPGSKRHAVREALATVTPIYAIHSGRHQATGKPTAFTNQLQLAIDNERGIFRGDGRPLLHRRLHDLVHSPPHCRNELLLRLVDALMATGKASSGQRYDFAALMVDVVRWDAPDQPSPAYWRSMLEPALA